MTATAISFPNLLPQVGKTMHPIQKNTAPDSASTALSEADAEKAEQRRQDLELVARAQAGDTSAFDTLVLTHSSRIYGLVYNMTSNHEDTNDLLQDIWAKVFRSLAGFRGQSAFTTWLHSISVNFTINFLKKRNRRTHVSLDDVDSGIRQDEDYIELAANSTPIREAGLNELQIRLNDAMQKLSEDHRAVVTMFDIQGMRHAEIAAVLKCSEGTVRSRLHYAHQHLKSLLSDLVD